MTAQFSSFFGAFRAQSPAVVIGERTLSYAELDERVARLADRLREHGAGPESVVAVSARSRLDVLFGLLATFRASGTYLPLDPGAPAERNEVILRGSGASILLRDGSEPTILSRQRNHATVSPGNAAYLVYTSGTTGKPKGVCVSYAVLEQHLESIRERFELTSEDRVLQFAAAHVDVSIEQMLAPLTAGATVVLRQDRRAPSFTQLIQLIEEQRITVANLPAAYWNEFAVNLDRLSFRPDHRLRLMISGSERMSPRAAREWQRHLPEVPLVNAYGPTECAITATTFRLPPSSGNLTEISLGTACAGRVLYVLDNALEPVLQDEQGELFIGGPLLARGYHGDPRLTARRFIPDPFSERPGARMYRTGDLVRQRGSGTLEFAGRVDDQVKIRGYRVEPGEVQRVLEQHPLVRSCAVLARSTGRGGPELIAWAVAPDSGDRELRTYLAGLLPSYAVPSAVVLLDELPLTPQGKLDRAALSVPDKHGTAEHDRQYVAARTPTEKLVASVWAEMFGLSRVGRNDNFFTLGGDSLAAVRFTARIMSDLGPNVPPQAVFSAPTLGALAAELDSVIGQASRMPLFMAGDRRSGGLSAGQRSLWFLDRWAPGRVTYNVPWVWDLSGTVDAAVLRQCLDVIMDRHQTLRTVFSDLLGEPRQEVLDHRVLHLSEHDVSATGVPAAAAEEIVTRAARAPFVLETGPLVRAALIRLGDRRFALAVTFHHIIWDEWSLGVFEHELTELYSAALAGRVCELPSAGAQYLDFVAWQQERLSGTFSSRELDYWRNRLAGAPELLELPTDRPRQATQSFNGATVGFEVPPDIARTVRTLAAGEGSTAYLVLLAAFATTLHGFTGQDDLVIGSPVAGRDRPELKELIGYFVNLLPLRVRIDGDPTFRQLVRRVRDSVREDLTHQEIPFDMIVEKVAEQRPIDRNPLVQVAFEMHKHDVDALRLGSVVGARRLVPTGTSKFDLLWQTTDDGVRFHGVVEYDCDLFNKGTVRAFVDCWGDLLRQVADDADTTVGELTARAAASIPHRPSADLVTTLEGELR